MSEQIPAQAPARPVTPMQFSAPGGDDQVNCGRCGSGMYRMQAVWRCRGCGHKTDTCGW
ncbi:MAG: hypothetical protein AB7H96_00705 [Vicinamibacterales bacterium]